MDFGYLFTSFDGRINRKPFWMGILIFIGIAIVAMIVLALLLNPLSRGFAVATLILQLALLYPSLALMVKRLHDRNRPDWWAYVMLAPSILSGLTNAVGITGNAMNQNALDYLLGLLSLIVGIWSLIELGILRGTQGPNQYGPDPLEGQPR